MTDNAAEIMALPEAKLIELLKSADAPVFAKAKACQRLAVIGTKAAVPALAALLAEAPLAHYARFGLEPIPDASVDEALRGALSKLKGRPLAGVINSVGQRKDAKAVDALAKLLKDGNTEVAQAAATALGHIGGSASAQKLQKALGGTNAPVRAAVADAGLACAEGLLAQGKRKEALSLYSALRGASMPKAVRDAATRGTETAGKH